jgi:hypothetical protein
MMHSKRVGARFSWMKFAKGIFRKPITEFRVRGSQCHIHLNGLVVCFNRLGSVLNDLPPEIKRIHIHFDQVFLIDGTSYGQLLRYQQEQNVVFYGLEDLTPMSKHPAATRMRTHYSL